MAEKYAPAGLEFVLVPTAGMAYGSYIAIGVARMTEKRMATTRLLQVLTPLWQVTVRLAFDARPGRAPRCQVFHGEVVAFYSCRSRRASSLNCAMTQARMTDAEEARELCHGHPHGRWERSEVAGPVV